MGTPPYGCWGSGFPSEGQRSRLEGGGVWLAFAHISHNGCSCLVPETPNSCAMGPPGASSERKREVLLLLYIGLPSGKPMPVVMQLLRIICDSRIIAGQLRPRPTTAPCFSAQTEQHQDLHVDYYNSGLSNDHEGASSVASLAVATAASGCAGDRPSCWGQDELPHVRWQPKQRKGGGVGVSDHHQQS